MVASTALSPCLGQLDAGQPWSPASAGTIILDTNPDRTATEGCSFALPDTVRNAWCLFLGWGCVAFLVGTVLCSRHCTTGQSSCERGLCCQRDLTENVRIFTATTLSKQCKEKGLSRAFPQRSRGWRLPRGRRLKTCDFCQENKSFSSDCRRIIAELVT